jgi:hypothetical protein
MGRRSRKRAAATPAPEAAARPEPPVRPARAARSQRAAPPPAAPERPRAPWHPFPLVELCVLIGLVLLVWGLIRHDDRGGRLLLVFGTVLASLGGLDTALREHFGGFRSHALLLAALPAVLTAGVLFFAHAPWIAVALAAAAVLGGTSVALRRAFERRS